MRPREEKPVDPRFRLQLGQRWRNGARVSRVTKPVRKPR